jgi:hypothetical protein
MAKRRGGAVATVTTKDADGNITSERVYASSPELKAVMASKNPDATSAVEGGIEPTILDTLQEPGPLGLPNGAWLAAAAGAGWWLLS